MLLSFGTMCASLAAWPTKAEAAELSDLLTRFFPTPPEPILYPRRSLTQPFAVLLMRSAYDTVDELDFIPMNDFQKNFWKLRASEQESYNLQYDPLKPKIGDITEPLYFDFISYSQFSTIAREIPKGQQVFKEYCEECEETGQFRTVRRDATYADNDLLPGRFFDRTGDRIYSGLKDGFRGTTFDAPGPLPAGAPLRQVTQRVQELLDIMVKNGYALGAEVYDVVDTPAERSFRVRLTGPANLWGLMSLAYRRALVVNAYDVMLTSAYLRACGCSAAHELQASPTGVEERWVLAA